MYNISYGRKYVHAMSKKTWTGKLEIYIRISDVILLFLLKYEKYSKDMPLYLTMYLITCTVLQALFKHL